MLGGLGRMGRLGQPALSKGGGFDLRAFMASQTDGFWFDFGQADWLRQEPNGPTAVAATNDVIGLALSRRLAGQGGTLAAYLAAQPEGVRNQAFAGGVAGTPGTLPTNMGRFSGGGLSTQVVGFGSVTVGGVSQPYMDYRIFGTASAASGAAVFFDGADGLSGAQNRLYAPSVIVAMVAGSVSNVVFARVIGDQLNAAGSLVGTRLFGADVRASLTSTPTQVPQQFFVADAATVAFVRPGFEITFNSGAVIDITLRFVLPSIKEVSRAAATQATLSFRPTFQTSGAKFDGTDDSLLTGYVAGAGANFVVARVTVPVSAPLTQVFFGSQTITAARFFLGVDTSGRLLGGAGSALAAADPDLRGREVVVGMSSNGSTSARMFADGASYDRTVAETPSTSVPVRIGAGNHNNTVSNPFAGSVRSIVAGREFIDLARFNQIAAALMAA